MQVLHALCCTSCLCHVQAELSDIAEATLNVGEVQQDDKSQVTISKGKHLKQIQDDHTWQVPKFGWFSFRDPYHGLSFNDGGFFSRDGSSNGMLRLGSSGQERVV